MPDLISQQISCSLSTFLFIWHEKKVRCLHVCCTSWQSIKPRPVTMTVTRRAKRPCSSGRLKEAQPDPTGSLLPVSSCSASFGARPQQPPNLSPADTAEPFISVTSHKSNHQLKAHYWSPDPSITEGRRRQMNSEAISVFPHSAGKKDDWFLLCLAVMCIRQQSIKYSLLLVGMSCDRVGENWSLGWRRWFFP